MCLKLNYVCTETNVIEIIQFSHFKNKTLRPYILIQGKVILKGHNMNKIPINFKLILNVGYAAGPLSVKPELGAL